MYFTNFANYRVFIDHQNGDDIFPPFNERPILYQRGNPQGGSPIAPLTIHSVEFTAGPNGSVSGQLQQAVASGASSGVVTAVADEGYSFAGWSGGYTGMRNPLYVRDVNSAQTITAHFQPASNPPSVTLVSPVQGTVLFVGETVTLTGTAFDDVDGDISELAVWFSNRDGNLGTGGHLAVTDLSPGLHQLTLSATNSNQQTALAQVLVWVQTGALVVPDTRGTNPSSNTPWMPVRVLAKHLAYSGLIRGSGLTAQSATDVFRGAPKLSQRKARIWHLCCKTITISASPSRPMRTIHST
ncbi:MAG: Ig-like domain-containing protein [Verrucomicrobia bacterium]|nr:Ig-like domain-containing protein [Verrucomicrobiota bacterium]